ncbi:MAG: hypothetical protein ACI9S8_002841 [Chlamydiales bacterium]|jgi:hypothetical protein
MQKEWVDLPRKKAKSYEEKNKVGGDFIHDAHFPLLN